jgi:hypothetical protein
MYDGSFKKQGKKTKNIPNMGIGVWQLPNVLDD